jgi:hypothetical protein
VEEKPADELLGRKRHRFLLAFVPVVFPLEAYLTSFDIQQAIVGDRDAVSVAADVIEHLLRAGKRRLGIDDPFCFSQRFQVTGKVGGISKTLQRGEESEFAGIERALEMFQK